jgi:hypothetical protein
MVPATNSQAAPPLRAPPALSVPQPRTPLPRPAPLAVLTSAGHDFRTDEDCACCAAAAVHANHTDDRAPAARAQSVADRNMGTPTAVEADRFEEVVAGSATAVALSREGL